MILKNNTPSVYGIGFLGGDVYIKNHNEKRYKVWHSMFTRCYSKENRNATYKKCVVSKKWRNFQNFAKWFEKNYVEEWQLDKDILVKNNKIYGENTCCFVPRDINSFFSLRKNNTGLPIGVRSHGNKYRAVCRYKGDRKHLGLFHTIEEASSAYKEQKNKFLKKLIEEYKQVLPEKILTTLINYKF